MTEGRRRIPGSPFALRHPSFAIHHPSFVICHPACRTPLDRTLGSSGQWSSTERHLAPPRLEDRPPMSASPLTGSPRHQLPDALGRFGAFGGRFVPETLMDALNQLAEEYERAKADPEFQARLDGYLNELRRPALAAVPRRAADRARPAGPPSTSSARTSTTPARTRSTTRSARPARAAHGQDARHRRDRRGPARRRHRDRLRPVRPGVHGLHGRGGHPPPEAQRLQHEDAGRDGRPGHERLRDAPRRHQRGDARLDGLVAARRTTSSAASSGRTRSR